MFIKSSTNQIPYRNQTKINHERQFKINQLLNDKIEKKYKNNEWPACTVYINGAKRWFPIKYFSVGGYSLSMCLVLLVIIII